MTTFVLKLDLADHADPHNQAALHALVGQMLDQAKPAIGSSQVKRAANFAYRGRVSAQTGRRAGNSSKKGDAMNEKVKPHVEYDRPSISRALQGSRQPRS
jgi:hypothetical protein